MPEISYVHSMIFCDEVRMENNGKEIAIGIYPGRMTLPALPFVIPLLTIRFELFFNASPVDDFSIKITDPLGNNIIEQKRPLSFVDWSMPGTLSIMLEGLIVSSAGSYGVMTKTSKHEWTLQRNLVIDKYDPVKAKTRWQEQIRRMEKGMFAEVSE